jgi:phage tail P2-like protein
MGNATLLPPNATPLETALAQTIANRIGGLTVPLRELWNPATCPLTLLPWLAWTLAADNWDSTWPESVKRARIASAIAIHRYKGTMQAVQDVITAYGGTVQLSIPAPFTFALLVALGTQSGTPPTAAYIDDVIADVTRAKGARDTFTFTVATNATAAIGVIGAARAAIYARLECAAAA